METSGGAFASLASASESLFPPLIYIYFFQTVENNSVPLGLILIFGPTNNSEWVAGCSKTETDSTCLAFPGLRKYYG